MDTNEIWAKRQAERELVLKQALRSEAQTSRALSIFAVIGIMASVFVAWLLFHKDVDFELGGLSKLVEVAGPLSSAIFALITYSVLRRKSSGSEIKGVIERLGIKDAETVKLMETLADTGDSDARKTSAE